MLSITEDYDKNVIHIKYPAENIDISIPLVDWCQLSIEHFYIKTSIIQLIKEYKKNNE